MDYVLISREDAKAQGLKKYYSGQPCAAGHKAERRVSNGHCVPCSIARSKNWALKNPERQAEHVRNYYERHPDYGAQQYAKNRDKHKAHAKAWSLKNPEKRRIIRRRWEQNNKAYRRAACAARRAARIQATPPWLSESQRKEILQFYRSCPKGWHVDHIKPLRGKNSCGLHVPWNLQYLSADENQRKGNREFD